MGVVAAPAPPARPRPCGRGRRGRPRRRSRARWPPAGGGSPGGRPPRGSPVPAEDQVARAREGPAAEEQRDLHLELVELVGLEGVEARVGEGREARELGDALVEGRVGLQDAPAAPEDLAPAHGDEDPEGGVEAVAGARETRVGVAELGGDGGPRRGDEAPAGLCVEGGGGGVARGIGEGGHGAIMAPPGWPVTSGARYPFPRGPGYHPPRRPPRDRARRPGRRHPAAPVERRRPRDPPGGDLGDPPGLRRRRRPGPRPPHLRTQRRHAGPRWRALAERAVALCRQAVGPDRRVAGSLAPLEDCYRPDRSAPNPGPEHAELAQALAAAGVDLLLCETFPHRGEAVAAVRAAVATGLPTWVAFTAGPGADLASPPGPWPRGRAGPSTPAPRRSWSTAPRRRAPCPSSRPSPPPGSGCPWAPTPTPAPPRRASAGARGATRQLATPISPTPGSPPGRPSWAAAAGPPRRTSPSSRAATPVDLGAPPDLSTRPRPPPPAAPRAMEGRP